MRLKTTTALAVALALPGAAHAASQATESTAPARATLRAPLPGHLKAGPTMRAEVRERIRDRRERRRAARQQQFTASPALEAIAACESGGDPTANTGNGFFGKYQFTLETWAAVGGTGNPAEASEAEQDRRAAMLYAQAGSSPWPVCGG